jgi:hypothetical protein
VLTAAVFVAPVFVLLVLIIVSECRRTRDWGRRL